MPEPDFNALRQQLAAAHIAPRHVKRAVQEIRDHYNDLCEAGVKQGLDRHRAEELARESLGDLRHVAAGMRAQPELRSWAFRYPHLATVYYPLACLLALPAMPLIAGRAHAAQLARWSLSLLTAGLFTASLLFVLQLAILFG